MLPKRTLLGAALAATLASSASAALIAYEGFDYSESVGTSITGLNGGTGWDEAYPAPGGGTLLLANGLAYSGTNALATVGKSVNFVANSNMSTGRDWADSTSAVASGTYYYSFQIDPVAAARGTLIIMKTTGSGDGQNGFGIRLDNNAGNPQFKAWSPHQAGGANIDFAGGYGSTYFVVGKITIVQSGTSTNSIAVFNSTGTIPLTEPTFASSVSRAWVDAAAASTQGDTLRTTLSGRAFSNNTGYRIDEIRIGETYADVASAIPEPSSFAALAGLGALGFIATRRRQQAK